MRFGENLVYFWIGDEMQIWIGKKLLHFEEEFARATVGAEGGDVTR